MTARLYVPSQNEATHPRCCDEGYPDGPGRASNKEGESWVIILRLLSESIRRNCVMQVQLPMAAVAARSGMWGSFPATEAAIRKLMARLAAKYRHLTFCYEAGPTGYGLYRLLESLGYECLVVAPSLVPKKAGDRVKTNRRDAVSLAKLLRAGELTAAWVPDERHEAMRDLSRARQAVKKDLKGKRQQISSLMLRLGRIYPGKTTWGPAHMKWLMAQKLEHREQRIAFEELIEGVRQESERVDRLENEGQAESLSKLAIALLT